MELLPTLASIFFIRSLLTTAAGTSRLDDPVDSRALGCVEATVGSDSHVIDPCAQGDDRRQRRRSGRLVDFGDRAARSGHEQERRPSAARLVAGGWISDVVREGNSFDPDELAKIRETGDGGDGRRCKRPSAADTYRAGTGGPLLYRVQGAVGSESKPFIVDRRLGAVGDEGGMGGGRILDAGQDGIARTYSAAIGLAEEQVAARRIRRQSDNAGVRRARRIELADERTRGRVDLIDVAGLVESSEQLTAPSEGQSGLDAAG